jgi:hypothetical protein
MDAEARAGARARREHREHREHSEHSDAEAKLGSCDGVRWNLRKLSLKARGNVLALLICCFLVVTKTSAILVVPFSAQLTCVVREPTDNHP